ncbi:unnamed protein product [Rotaria magnacalcarata]|uniref:F-box domain-containing protein n=1 Tax=Rotaria magnacalcarata TaxID=392030 RepID=A0A816U400_9BILA|nr:unnamed protein product [Rotaria magnacalcarata]
MEGSLLTLIDSPDEALLLILKNLDNIEVLYLFIDLNKSFNKLVHDSIFTNHLTMIRCSSNGSFDRLDDHIHDRFCSQILPSIHHNIKWLDVACSSMEDVLLCTSYPNLSGLDLHHIERDIALQETPLTHIFQDKISSLAIGVVRCERLKLHIKLDKFADCLYLLDSRFDSLENVFLDICQISTPEIVINNKKELSKLKAFSLYSDRPTFQYNELIVPLLYRMVNLEELDLHLVVHYFKHGQCHIYSYPYRAKTYEYITNNFPGGLFKYVREVSLYDDRLFEHDFFVKIAESFPFMEQLTIYNRKPQTNKFYEQSNYDSQHLSPIQYSYLSVFELFWAHDDYVEQFLLDIKTSLIRTVNLQVLVSTLDRVTHSFTRDATRTNCRKLFSIYVPRDISISTQLKDYFPHTKACTISISTCPRNGLPL